MNKNLRIFLVNECVKSFLKTKINIMDDDNTSYVSHSDYELLV